MHGLARQVGHLDCELRWFPATLPSSPRTCGKRNLEPLEYVRKLLDALGNKFNGPVSTDTKIVQVYANIKTTKLADANAEVRSLSDPKVAGGKVTELTSGMSQSWERV